MHRLTNISKAILIFLLLFQIIVAAWGTKFISWDPSYGMLAAQQYVVGVSPSPFKLAQADPDDLTRIKVDDVPFWAPLYQAIPYVFRLGGALKWGTALDLTNVVFVVLAIVGWHYYFVQILGSGALANWLTVGVASTRFCCMASLVYDGGNLLLWGLAPWSVVFTILVAKASAESRIFFAASMAGVFAGSMYAAKYSAIFLIGGLFVALAVRSALHGRGKARAAAFGIGAAATVAFIRFLGFPKYSVARVTGLHPIRGILSLGLWTLGPGDIDALFGKPLDWARIQTDTAIPVVGLVLLAGISASLWTYSKLHRRGENAAPARRALPAIEKTAMLCGVCAAAADIAALFLMIALGSNISLQARFGRVSGLLLLPILCVIWLELMRRAERWPRFLGAFCLALFFLVPCVYGPISVLPKWIEAYRTGSTAIDDDGVVNQDLPRRVNQKEFYRQVETGITPGTILYTIYPQMAFPIARHPCIIMEAEEDYTAKSLAALRYRGTPSGGVALLVRTHFVENGKPAAIERSFVDIKNWRNIPLPADPTWSLWVSY